MIDGGPRGYSSSRFILAFGLSATTHRKFHLSTEVPLLQQKPTEVCVAAVDFSEEMLQGNAVPQHIRQGSALSLSPLSEAASTKPFCDPSVAVGHSGWVWDSLWGTARGSAFSSCVCAHSINFYNVLVCFAPVGICLLTPLQCPLA